MSSCSPQPDLDFSKMTFPGKIPQPLPAWEEGLKIASCVLVEVVAILGNLLLLAIVARSPRMRTTINCYIANMAVADLLIAVVPTWIHVSNDVMNKDGWPFGAFLCKFSVFVQVTAMVASVMTLMAIAGDRFFAIIFPLKSRVTERRVGVVVAVVWLSSLAIGAPPLFFYTYHERQWKNYLETFCTDVWPATFDSNGVCDEGMTSKRAYWTLVTVVLNWLPMVVMSIAYAIIIHQLRFSRVQPAAGGLSMSAVQRRSKRKVVQMLLIVLVTFMACTIPFQVTNLYPIYSSNEHIKLPSWHYKVYYAAVFLMYTNAAINPVLYGGLNDGFRQGARDLFNCILCRKVPRFNLSFTTNLSLSRARSTATDVGSVKSKKDKPSLRRLVSSSSYLSTAMTPQDDLEGGVKGMPSRNSTVQFFIGQENVRGSATQNSESAPINEEHSDEIRDRNDVAVYCGNDNCDSTAECDNSSQQNGRVPRNHPAAHDDNACDLDDGISFCADGTPANNGSNFNSNNSNSSDSNRSSSSSLDAFNIQHIMEAAGVSEAVTTTKVENDTTETTHKSEDTDVKIAQPENTKQDSLEVSATTVNTTTNSTVGGLDSEEAVKTTQNRSSVLPASDSDKEDTFQTTANCNQGNQNKETEQSSSENVMKGNAEKPVVDSQKAKSVVGASAVEEHFDHFQVDDHTCKQVCADNEITLTNKAEVKEHTERVEMLGGNVNEAFQGDGSEADKTAVRNTADHFHAT